MKKNLCLIAIIMFVSCTPEISTKKERLKIVCTTSILGDAISHIVQNKAEVKSLMGAGVDPHLYKATQGDLKLLTDADIIVYNGLHLEGKMGELFEKLKNRKHILVASDGIKEEDLINNSDFQGAHDPHLWFDVQLWSDVIAYLGEQIGNHHDSLKKGVTFNTALYINHLKSLHLEVQQAINTIDSTQRVLITAHDAFGYFGRAYNIEVKGLQGISTLSEYGLKDVSELVNYIANRKIKAVFVESSVSDRSLKAVVEGCKSKGHEVKIGGTLYSDAMGEAGTEEGTYRGMINYNVRTIVNALK